MHLGLEDLLSCAFSVLCINCLEDCLSWVLYLLTCVFIVSFDFTVLCNYACVFSVFISCVFTFLWIKCLVYLLSCLFSILCDYCH